MAQQKGRTSKADATRRQLLDAAIEVISERGYADTTVERIVEVAGVSKGVAYYHFSSKADTPPASSWRALARSSTTLWLSPVRLLRPWKPLRP